MESDKILNRLMLIATLIYAATLNDLLFISIVGGFLISVLFVLIIESNDRELMNWPVTGEMPEHIIKKYGEVLFFGFAIFVLTTILFYNLFTNN